MTDVTVTNRRADSSANQNLTRLARHGADSFGYKAELRIDGELAQLLRLRGCLRSTTAPTASTSTRHRRPPTRDRYLTAWWETDFHDEATRAALAYTEAITRVADATVADDFGLRHAALADHFSPEEILEIIGIVNQRERLDPTQVGRGRHPGFAEQAMS
jgi:alkylhydroperoxidase family enzyme